jgi:hypothetical protein
MKQLSLFVLLSLFICSNIFGAPLPPFLGYYFENKAISDVKIILRYEEEIDLFVFLLILFFFLPYFPT